MKREEETKVVLNGDEVYFSSCVALMDDEIREILSQDLAPCTEQEFIDAYAIAHFEIFGKKFKI